MPERVDVTQDLERRFRLQEEAKLAAKAEKPLLTEEPIIAQR